MLGHAETIGSHGDLFQLEDRRNRIYVKKGAEIRASGPYVLDPQVQRPPVVRPPLAQRDDLRTAQNEADRLLLDRFAPAGVVVDEDMQIVHFRGQTGPYLEPPPGEPSLHLFKMAREGLLHGLRDLIGDARRTGRSTRNESVHVKRNGAWDSIAVEVVPLHASQKRHFLVLFAPSDEPAAALPSPSPAPAGTDADDRLRTLEEELGASRHYLQSIIQELEAANEELQSANEEILSSNEELQSTNEELDTAKEELQSTNEELNTVNDELHGRNEELSRANGDLVNVISSVQIAIVIVSADLRVRRFTPMAERMLHLLATDIGRPLGHLKPEIDCPNLEELIREAIDGVSAIERRVQDRQGCWFSLRIRPYKSGDDRIDGAVLALFDIDALHRQEMQLRDMRHYADAMVAVIHQPVVVLAHDLRIRTVNGAFESAFGMNGDAAGQSFLDLGGGVWNVPALRDALGRLSSHGSALEHVQIDREISGAERRRVRIEARRIDGPDGLPPLILLVFENPPPKDVGNRA